MICKMIPEISIELCLFRLLKSMFKYVKPNYTDSNGGPTWNICGRGYAPRGECVCIGGGGVMGN